MDYLGGATAVAINKPVTSAGVVECIIGVVVAVAVLRIEVLRRTADLPPTSGGAPGSYARKCRKLLRQHAPEVAGLATCLGVASALRIQGGFAPTVDEKTWAEIMRQWPILLTADSLLALQAMFRLVVFLSAVLRGGQFAPLSQEAAVLLCSAAVGRVALAARSTVYRLDGPLGGLLPICCEVASVPLLASLSRGIRPKALVTSSVTVLAAASLGYRNRLTLADDAIIDGLFTFAHSVEFFAGFAYLCRSLLYGAGRSTAAVRFAHFMMPLQQLLAAYYFVQAFDAVPELVASGHPFQLLQVAGITQLGVYAGAAVLHAAECLEDAHEEQMEVHEEEEEAVPSRQAEDASVPVAAYDLAWDDDASANVVPCAVMSAPL